MNNKEEIEYKEPPMKYNPGRAIYEPNLPTKKENKKSKLKIEWKWIIILLIAIIFITLGAYIMTT